MQPRKREKGVHVVVFRDFVLSWLRLGSQSYLHELLVIHLLDRELDAADLQAISVQ